MQYQSLFTDQLFKNLHPFFFSMLLPDRLLLRCRARHVNAGMCVMEASQIIEMGSYLVTKRPLLTSSCLLDLICIHAVGDLMEG